MHWTRQRRAALVTLREPRRARGLKYKHRSVCRTLYSRETVYIRRSSAFGERYPIMCRVGVGGGGVCPHAEAKGRRLTQRALAPAIRMLWPLIACDSKY